MPNVSEGLYLFYSVIPGTVKNFVKIFDVESSSLTCGFLAWSDCKPLDANFCLKSYWKVWHFSHSAIYTIRPTPGEPRGATSTLECIGLRFDPHPRRQFFINLRHTSKAYSKQKVLVREWENLEASRWQMSSVKADERRGCWTQRAIKTPRAPIRFGLTVHSGTTNRAIPVNARSNPNPNPTHNIQTAVISLGNHLLQKPLHLLYACGSKNSGGRGLYWSRPVPELPVLADTPQNFSGRGICGDWKGQKGREYRHLSTTWSLHRSRWHYLRYLQLTPQRI